MIDIEQFKTDLANVIADMPVEISCEGQTFDAVMSDKNAGSKTDMAGYIGEWDVSFMLVADETAIATLKSPRKITHSGTKYTIDKTNLSTCKTALTLYCVQETK